MRVRNLRTIHEIPREWDNKRQVMRYEQKVSFAEHILRGTDVCKIAKDLSECEDGVVSNIIDEHEFYSVLNQIPCKIIMQVLYNKSIKFDCIDEYVERVINDMSTIWPHNPKIDFGIINETFTINMPMTEILQIDRRGCSSSAKVAYLMSHCVYHRETKRWINVTNGRIRRYKDVIGT